MSLVISADSQNLIASSISPALWASATNFTVFCKVKITTAQWGNIFGIADTGDEAYNNASIRTASGTSYDHSLVLQSADQRLSSGGAVTAGWDTVGITVEGGVARISYLNGSAQETVSGSQASWINGQGLDEIVIGSLSSASYMNTSGRFKVAHCAVWKSALSSTQMANLHNGGSGGGGVNPTTVDATNLVFYAPLTADATVDVGGITLTANGSPTFDGTDNPVVDSVGGASATFAITADDATFSGTGYVQPIASFALTADSAIFSGTASSGAADASFALTTDSSTFSGTATGDTSQGILTTPALKNNTGTLLANETGATAYVYNVSTGALVVSKTGQTTNASGVMQIMDALIVASTQYRVVIVLGSGAEGMDKITAT